MTQGIGSPRIPEGEGISPKQKPITEKLPIAAPIPVIMTDKPLTPKTPIADLPRSAPVEVRMDQVAIKAVSISQKTILLHALLEEMASSPTSDMRGSDRYPQLLRLYEQGTRGLSDIIQAIAANEPELQEEAEQLQSIIKLTEEAYGTILGEKDRKAALELLKESLREEFPEEGSPTMVIAELVEARMKSLPKEV